MARKPAGLVFEVLTPIAADYFFQYPEWMKGIKIYATSNKEKVLLTGTASCTARILASPSVYKDLEDDQKQAVDQVSWLAGGGEPFPWRPAALGSTKIGFGF